MGHTREVLVVGGGPAGLAAAIAARKKGFRVAVAEAAKPPIDKACGEGMLPGTLQALAHLGIRIGFQEGRIFQGIRFRDETLSAEAKFSEGHGVGMRRTALHQKMVEQAQASGIELLWNTPVTDISEDGAILSGERIYPQWIVGADGIHSRVRRWSGLGTGGRGPVRFAQRRHYRVKPWTDYVEVYWGRKMQAYVTPLANDETCVVLISRRPQINFSEALREFPKLTDGLKNAELTSAQRGSVTAIRQLSRVCCGRIALIGDASGSVDAITGEGLGLSFRQALALAEAMKAGQLDSYQKAHRKLAERPNTMARLLLLLDRSRLLRKRVLRGLSRDPELFESLLAAHTQDTSLAFLTDAGVRLGWRLLTA